MCYNPTKIPNPNYGKKFGKKYESIHDTTAQYISVPCGHCYACLAIRQEYFIQRMQMENISNDLWTGMLSYNDTSLPTIIIGKYSISYASSRDIQLLIKRLRNRRLFPNGFKYWFISERGSMRHRPHWHFIISTPKIPDESIAEKYHREKIYHDAILEEWYTNHGSKRSPVKVPNLTYCCKHGKRNYDFHYCNPLLTKDGNSDVAFYASKYYLKVDDYSTKLKGAIFTNYDEDTAEYYWSIVRNKTLSSHFIGDIKDDPLIKDHLNKCLEYSVSTKSPYPLFINPVTSQTFPLSPYYRKYIPFEVAYALSLNRTNVYDGIMCSDVPLKDDLLRKDSQFQKVKQRINERDVDYSLIIYDYEGNIYKDSSTSQISEAFSHMGEALPNSNHEFDFNDFSFHSLWYDTCDSTD